jgi:hypothetical protein
MISVTSIPANEINSGQASAGPGKASIRWIAGIRYPGGTRIWCATDHGDDAWTTDRKLATGFPSESSAAIAARLLADGAAVPFWSNQDA